MRAQPGGLVALLWAVSPSDLPRGIGLDVAGIVEAVGEGETDVRVGQRVLGVPDDGASRAPARRRAWSWPFGLLFLGLVDAAALPTAIETACRNLDILSEASGQTRLVYSAGTVIGFAAAQMVPMRGARVVAAAGDMFAGWLRAFGAIGTLYGDSLAGRTVELVPGALDLVFDAGPVSFVLPDLVRIAGGEAGRVLTVSNHGLAAGALGVHNSFGSGLRYDALARFVALTGDPAQAASGLAAAHRLQPR